MKDKPRLTTDFVTIPREEYETLKMRALFAEIAGDILDDMPTDFHDLAESHPRYMEWLKRVNPEWFEEKHGQD